MSFKRCDKHAMRSSLWYSEGRTFSIHLCPLSFWMTLPWGVLSTSWCCPSRPCVAFLACVHLALFLALSRIFPPTPLSPHGVTIVCSLPCFDVHGVADCGLRSDRGRLKNINHSVFRLLPPRKIMSFHGRNLKSIETDYMIEVKEY